MIIPKNENVLVKPLDREVKTGSGLIIGSTSTMEEGLKLGEIVHPGNSDFKKGDKIFYSAYSSVWVSDDKGDSYHMICHLDIMGIEK
jgi:co-chaperonin GroES (HSP10)